MGSCASLVFNFCHVTGEVQEEVDPYFPNLRGHQPQLPTRRAGWASCNYDLGNPSAFSYTLTSSLIPSVGFSPSLVHPGLASAQGMRALALDSTTSRVAKSVSMPFVCLVVAS
jgi:hypothetical protein